MKTYELVIDKNNESLMINLGYNVGRIVFFLIDRNMQFSVIDIGTVCLNNVDENQINELKDFLVNNELKSIGRFVEITSLELLKEEVDNGIAVLSNLKPTNVQNFDEDELMLIIDDIFSSEEQMSLYKIKLIENIHLNPLLDKSTIKGIIDVLGLFASKDFMNSETLDLLGKKEIGPSFVYEHSSDLEKTELKKLALVDFLITSSDTYLEQYRILKEKLDRLFL